MTENTSPFFKDCNNDDNELNPFIKHYAETQNITYDEAIQEFIIMREHVNNEHRKNILNRCKNKHKSRIKKLN